VVETTKQQARELAGKGVSKAEIGRQLGVPRETVRGWLAKAFEVEMPTDVTGLTVDELVEDRKRRFDRKRIYEESRQEIQVRVNVPGPIGILHFGDPHVDDDGTDIAALERHTQLVRDTEGLFAANVGDTTNNWVGRLARLYGEQSTSAAEAWALAEWFVRRCDWLYMIGGNHDCWSGAGDPLKWIAGQSVYESSQVRLRLNLPSKRSVTINARHDFAGHSQWNPTHGVMKAAQMGVRDDILVCGHKHVSGYQPLKIPGEDRIAHCLQVASYKVFDRYAKERGFRDQHISPSVLTIVDPGARKPEGFVQVFHDIELGVDFLRFLRERKAAA
jgi:hypothetical protein